MSKQNTIQIHNISIHLEQPTSLTFDELYEWVIWQFPQQKKGGLSGAVRPPLFGASWYPALIHPKEKRIQVYGHLDTSYSTPEEASKRILKEL
jgi:hypothetical protein